MATNANLGNSFRRMAGRRGFLCELEETKLQRFGSHSDVRKLLGIFGIGPHK